jgi:hypothetical protein
MVRRQRIGAIIETWIAVGDSEFIPFLVEISVLALTE